MPITQDRLIRLIDITTRTLEWAETIKTLIKVRTEESIGIINSLDQNSDINRILLGLAIVKQKLGAIDGVLHDLPLSPHDMLALGEERGHFNATSRHNTNARNHMRAVRAGKVEQKPKPATLTPEHLAEVEEELQNLWKQDPKPAAPETNGTIANDIAPTEGDTLDLNLPKFMS